MKRGTFFDELRQSGLLSRQAIDEAAARFPGDARGRAITRILVAEGLLTRFQARKLLAGRGKGLLLEPYHLLEQIGRGATGSVFKALHSTMGRVVAIKIMRPRVLHDNAAVDLFEREVRAVALLQHPGIATAYDAGVTRGRHFLVMEYVDGPSLQSLVQTHGPLPVGLACELMRQAVEALQYAHDKGMVHRDIKPANLLIAHLTAGEKEPGVVSGSTSDNKSEATPELHSPTPVVKIIDFGLARVRYTARAGIDATIKVEPGTVWGTVDYIAPEQAQNIHAADIRSDLYSLGCTFYFALTGQAPFSGRSDLEKLIKHKLHDAPPVTEVRPEIPVALAAIIERLMAKDQTRRFQTPAELAQELAGVSDTRVSGIRTPEMHAHDFSRQRAGVGDKGDSGQTLSDPSQKGDWSFEDRGTGPVLPDDAQGTIDELFRSAPPVEKGDSTLFPAPPLDRSILENWRRWTAIIEAFAQGRESRRRVEARSYALLRKQLLEECEAYANAADGVSREFFLSLAELVRPWLNPDALLRTERDLLYSLLALCQQAEQGLKAMMTPGRSQGNQTLLGGILSLLKRW